MFKRTLLIFLLFASFSVASEQCRVPNLEELEYTDIECQFYLGTTAYRNQIYTVAAAHWQFIVDAPVKNKGDESIKAMALGTITFLTYQGLGVKQNKTKAVKDWKKAAAQGDFEARRHLGYAYSDSSYSGKDLVKALGWYESIFVLYPTSKDIDESDLNIYRDAREAASKLKTQLSSKQIELANSFAKTTL